MANNQISIRYMRQPKHNKGAHLEFIEAPGLHVGDELLLYEVDLQFHNRLQVCRATVVGVMPDKQDGFTIEWVGVELHEYGMLPKFLNLATSIMWWKE